MDDVQSGFSQTCVTPDLIASCNTQSLDAGCSRLVTTRQNTVQDDKQETDAAETQSLDCDWTEVIKAFIQGLDECETEDEITEAMDKLYLSLTKQGKYTNIQQK